MDNQAVAIPETAPKTEPASGRSTPSNVGILDEFQDELIRVAPLLPNKIFFFTLLIAWLALFQFFGNSIMGYIKTPSLFAWMYESYTSPNPVAENDRHGTLIPFLVLGLFWVKRNELLALPLRLWSPAVVLVLGAMVMHVIAYIVQVPHLSIVALFVGIYGLMGIEWGPQFLWKSLFPFFLFIFSVPLGSRGDFITVPLQLLVCWSVELICHDILALDIIRAGTQLFDPSGTYSYEVAAACSGMRSLVAVFLLATVYGFVVFKSPWKRLAMMATAVPLAVIGNLFRMLCIVGAAQIGGQSWGNYVHDSGLLSLLPYVPAIFGVMIVGNYLGDKKSKEPANAN